MTDELGEARTTPDLLHVLTKAVGARRVLEIGTGHGASGLQIATALPDDGLLITLERDTGAARAARALFADHHVAARVAVMIGEASRYLHKIAGPFDLIVQDGDPAQYDACLDRLLRLLAPRGTLITCNTAAAGDYNRRLAANPRVRTAFLPVAGGLAISVTQQSRHDD